MSDTTSTPIAKPIRFRRLKIAWTVFFAMLTVALCVLWVRSYWCCDIIPHTTKNSSSTLNSNWGIVWFRSSPPVGNLKWAYDNLPANDLVEQELAWSPNFIKSPHWFLVIVTASIVALPWLPLRFSLRTMLIVTALVAVVLGLIVYAVGK